MRHIVFLLAYIYFLYTDFKEKKIQIVAMGIYAIVALLTIAFAKNEITMTRLIDVIFSVFFGLVVYLLSYFSDEGIGLADGMFFVINGFLLTLKENILLFLSGLFVAFICGLFIYIFCKKVDRNDMRMPFMPCCLPAIIGYIICIV